MKSPLGTFLNAPALRKPCAWFFKLSTTKIPWSNHRLVTVLVAPSCGETRRSLSLARGAQSSGAHRAGEDAPSPPLQVRYLVSTDAFDVFGKAFTIATTCPAEDHRTQPSAHPAAAEVPSRAPPGWRAASHRRAGLLAPPGATLPGRTSLSSASPKPIGRLEGHDLRLGYQQSS